MKGSPSLSLSQQATIPSWLAGKESLMVGREGKGRRGGKESKMLIRLLDKVAER